jgi:hypothetical protein
MKEEMDNLNNITTVKITKTKYFVTIFKILKLHLYYLY